MSHGAFLSRAEAPVLLEAIRRAEQLHGGEEEAVNPDLLRAHVLEGLLHRVTREDAVLETVHARLSNEGSRFPDLTEMEAAEIGDALVRDDVTGDDLLGFLDVLPEFDVRAVRELAARRIDEALGSKDPVYWAEPLATRLELDRTCVSETESSFPIQAEADDPSAGSSEETSLELEEESLLRPEPAGDLLERFEREAIERWAAFRESWPRRRQALVP